MAWEYKRQEATFKPAPEGRQRIRIKSAEKSISKSGNDMIVLQFDVSASTATLYHYIVFLDDRPEITNRNLTQFFDSFKGIEDGDFNMDHWIGKTGACLIAHEDDGQGGVRARIKYFIRADKQDDLPPWRESDGYSPMDMDDNPFF